MYQKKEQVRRKSILGIFSCTMTQIRKLQEEMNEHEKRLHRRGLFTSDYDRARQRKLPGSKNIGAFERQVENSHYL